MNSTNSVLKNTQSTSFTWSSLYLFTFFSAFLFMLMEWLFIITKPSFMNPLPFFQKMEILLFSSALLAGFSFISLIPLILLQFPHLFRKYHRVLIQLGVLLPTFLMSSLSLLLIDNFTYTIFEFGIVSTKGITRGLYVLILIFIFIFLYRKNLQLVSSIDNQIRNQSVKKWVVVGLSVVILISIIIPLSGQDIASGIIPGSAESQGRSTLPNILLITPDGVNANNLSLYGYERNTTPFLKDLASTSLIAENAFTNSANTGGSITSIFTGKYPATTRVFFPPDILRNEDAYEHLPAILHSRGYKTIQLGFPTYVDAYTFNLLSGFDEVNGRVFLNSSYLLALNDYLPDESAYFIYETGNRLIDRLLHIFFIKQMENPFAQVTESPEDFNDSIKLAKLFELIDHSDRPLFVHLHWMGTHGGKFFPDQQVFSLGKEVEFQKLWDVDFYDDSILEFDRAVEAIFEKLTQENILDRTMIIIGSDHGQQFFTNERLPFIIHFPGGQFSGRIEENVQN
ncbi:MAG: sulfatase-like hydrolase/transferase [Anaerolineaceae bacterium]|nr:sulfatase-like hydrolase/transferase [Anaerolineaceae bacterium]